MGYNSYMGHTSVVTIAEYFVSSGMIHSGCRPARKIPALPSPLSSSANQPHPSGSCGVSRYEYVNSDEGWEEKNRSKAGRIVPNTAFGGNDAGMKALVAKIHGMGLKLGLYGAASGVTCGNMPGQLCECARAGLARAHFGCPSPPLSSFPPSAISHRDLDRDGDRRLNSHRPRRCRCSDL